VTAQTDKILSCMTRFNRSPRTNPYAVITPDTPLADLESFLKDHIFALSTPFCFPTSESGPRVVEIDLND
jgi:hypothetical protein